MTKKAKALWSKIKRFWQKEKRKQNQLLQTGIVEPTQIVVQDRPEPINPIDTMVKTVESRIGRKLDMDKVAAYQKFWNHAFAHWNNSPEEQRKNTRREKYLNGLADSSEYEE